MANLVSDSSAEEKTTSPNSQSKAAESKSIVIFADGTGNAFSTQESNVWRLYQALDKSEGHQIAHYIKGVGTSGFRPYALLDGATGIGVPSNVRKLYEFICWNWHPGDRICMFGFSRGSFTIRTLIGLINHEGLVPCEIGETVSRHEMRRNVMAAWRSYRSKTIPNSILRVSPLIPLTRVVRNLLIGAYHWLSGHRTYKQVREQTELQERLNVPIRFVGLFDTVEAFGVPIEEFRRAIDWAIWPISFTNRRLSDRVERAFHALSLDDERTTFHPLRFDMGGEKPGRIEEVWFAGVHSDVGGGYPDADLEHVPLVWMAEHAAGIGGLHFTAGAVQAFREAASAVGPRHDSRDGLGVFYRYGPRVIRDGADDGGPPVIHHSVAERMVFGSDGYAPIVLPSTAIVLLPDGSKQTIRGFEPEKRKLAPPPAEKLALPVEMERALAAVRAIRNPDPYIVSLVRDHVWWRRVAYFALLAAALLAFSMPWSAEYLTAFAGGAGNRTAEVVGAGSLWNHIWGGLSGAGGSITAVLASVLALVGGFIPGYVKPWIDVLSAQPITCLVVLAALLVLYGTNGYLRDRIADLARQAWFPSRRERGLTQGETPEEPKKTFAWFMRTSGLTNTAQKAFTNFLLPGLGIVAIYLAAFVAMDRSLVSVYEGHGDICRATTAQTLLVPGRVTVLPKKFETGDDCWASGITLEKGRRYTIRLKMEEPYFDGAIMSDIAGFQDSSWRHALGLPFRRWWSADWFQPIARIGSVGDIQWKLESIIGDKALPAGTDRAGSSFDARFFTDPLFKARLSEINMNNEIDPRRTSGAYRIPDKDMPLAAKIRDQHKFQNEYVSEFVAPAEGELFLYINDVLMCAPWGPISYYYKNNRGSATVSVLMHDNPPL